MRWVLPRIAASLLLAFAPTILPAQQVIDTPRGPLELIGLRRWTYQMLEDSLARYAPGETLRSHACAGVLQEMLGFPSASVVQYSDGTLSPHAKPASTFIVTVVEPQDSALVRARLITSAPRRDRVEWTAIRRAIADSAGKPQYNALINLMQFYGTARRLGADSARAAAAWMGTEEAAQGAELWAALLTRDRAADRALALATIANDGNAGNRRIAAALLANFPESDAAWRGIVAAVRDPDAGVQYVATQSLAVLARDFARPVDWTPATADIRLLLAGTHVHALPTLMRALTSTQVNPALAAPLLADNGELVLAHARARYEMARTPAWSFLGQISGRPDAGPAEWQAWVSTLTDARRSRTLP